MIHKYRLSGLKSKCGLTLITGFDKIWRAILLYCCTCDRWPVTDSQTVCDRQARQVHIKRGVVKHTTVPPPSLPPSLLSSLHLPLRVTKCV